MMNGKFTFNNLDDLLFTQAANTKVLNFLFDNSELNILIQPIFILQQYLHPTNSAYAKNNCEKPL